MKIVLIILLLICVWMGIGDAVNPAIQTPFAPLCTRHIK